jgi:hypothetical protein
VTLFHPDLARAAYGAVDVEARDVAYLMQDLRALRADYVTNREPTGRREIAAWALVALAQFIDRQSPSEENLALPLVDLVGALVAIGDGDLLPMVTPKQKSSGGRRPRNPSRRLFEVYPTAAIDILMSEPSGLSKNEAAKFVVSELNRLGIRIDGRRLDYQQLIEWRKRLREDQSGSRESKGYWRFAQQVRAKCFLDPKGAVRRMLKGLASEGFGLTDATAAPKGE